MAILTQSYVGLSLVEGLRKLASEHPSEAVFTTSFGLEDQVVTHAILSESLPIRIATLDTGRLFSETYDVWQKTNIRYGNKIEAFFPNAQDVSKFLNEGGPNSIFDSIENRKECCRIRKVLPLDLALQGSKFWITGLRREQSGFRSDLELFEEDKTKGIWKYQPLLEWTWEETWKYIREHNVPYNILHEKGFPSIGCAPCTRAISEGEDFRAGRWWWETESQKECGLHWVDGKLTPKKGT